MRKGKNEGSENSIIRGINIKNSKAQKRESLADQIKRIEASVAKDNAKKQREEELSGKENKIRWAKDHPNFTRS